MSEPTKVDQQPLPAPPDGPSPAAQAAPAALCSSDVATASDAPSASVPTMPDAPDKLSLNAAANTASAIEDSEDVSASPSNPTAASSYEPKAKAETQLEFSSTPFTDPGQSSTSHLPHAPHAPGEQDAVLPRERMSSEAPAPEDPSGSSEPVPEYDPNIVIGGQTCGPINISIAQVKFLQNVIKALKGRNEAKAFLAPVDPIALGIPHYRSIITHPMDLGTIDIKLALTAAAVKGGNKPTEKVKLAPRWGLDIRKDIYTSPQQLENDVRLTFNNTRVFNGPLHLISLGADALEQVFDKQIKSLPAPDAPLESRKGSTDPLADTRKSLDLGRPKRDVHPPPPPIPYVDQEAPIKPSTKYRRDSMSLAEESHWDKVAREEVRFCGKVINELLKPVHSDFAWVFYELPDRNLDYAPAYYAMIEHPVALTTVLNKLRNGRYADADEFDADMQLLFRNCFTFNPLGSDVYLMGERLKAVYDRAFAKLPEPKAYVIDPPPAADMSEAKQLSQILHEQAQILHQQATELEGAKPSAKAVAQGRSTLVALGVLAPLDVPSPAPPSSVGAGQKRRKSMTNGEGAPKKSPTKKPKKQAVPASAPSSSASGPAGVPPAQTKKAPIKRARKSKAGDVSDEEDVRVVTYEQKEELANKIQTLSEERMEGALKIIAEDRPENPIDDEEIELDIDDLSPRTLYKLYRYVVRPKDKKTTHSKPVKSASDGRKRGTGGLKRKNLDESEETERIRRLQAQLQQFEGTTASAPVATTTHDDLVNSESSGDEDSDSGEDF